MTSHYRSSVVGQLTDTQQTTCTAKPTIKYKHRVILWTLPAVY